jgi:hypothetical protein
MSATASRGSAAGRQSGAPGDARAGGARRAVRAGRGMPDGDGMNGFGRQLEGSAGAGESVERVLDAIEFQTAILTLNAAVEAAHTPQPAPGSVALTQHIAERPAEGREEPMAAPWHSAAFPPMAESGRPTPQTAGNCGAPAGDSGVQGRIWQESLERLRQSLGVACGVALPRESDGRPQADKARPQPASAPEPVPAPRPRPSQLSPRDPLERGP